MRFRSTASQAQGDLRFSFPGHDYVVAPGETVEIEDRWIPWVKSRGLLLEEAPEPPPAPPEDDSAKPAQKDKKR